jgi:hypothetical protein
VNFIRRIARRTFESAGLFIRPTRGLPRGVNFFVDLVRHWGKRSPATTFDVGANIGRSLDSPCREIGVCRSDLPKINCEGFNLDVLRGAAEWLYPGATTCVDTEVSFRRDQKHGDYFPITPLLRPLGYDFHALYDYSRSGPHVGIEGFANALFVRRASLA